MWQAIHINSLPFSKPETNVTSYEKIFFLNCSSLGWGSSVQCHCNCPDCARSLSVTTSTSSPRHNRSGWLGAKHQVTYYVHIFMTGPHRDSAVLLSVVMVWPGLLLFLSILLSCLLLCHHPDVIVMVDWVVKPVSFLLSFLPVFVSFFCFVLVMHLKSLVNSALVQQITVEEIGSIKCDRKAVTQTLLQLKVNPDIRRRLV